MESICIETQGRGIQLLIKQGRMKYVLHQEIVQDLL